MRNRQPPQDRDPQVHPDPLRPLRRKCGHTAASRLNPATKGLACQPPSSLASCTTTFFKKHRPGEKNGAALCSWTVCTIKRDENGLEEEILRAWQRNQQRLLALLARLTSRQEAPDLLQETFLRVYKAKPQEFYDQLSFKYLRRAAITTATDYKQNQHAMKAATAEYLEQLRIKGLTEQATAERRLLFRQVQEAAIHLSQDDQELLKAYSVSESIAAEARRIGIPASTLASRYKAAIKRLQRQLMP